MAEIVAQNPTLTGALPLDRPTHERPFRLYVATTNHCNRACPWCCTCSSPKGSTFLRIEDLRRAFPSDGPFEVQLEGGEPTVHPSWWAMVALARAEPRCTRVVLVTNGVLFPRSERELGDWLERLGAPLTIKLSINHHLLEHDPGLIDLAKSLAKAFAAGADRELVLNVRLRPGVDADRQIPEAIRTAGLEARANVFFLQRYGYAADEAGWAPPFLVGDRFVMLNPDGRELGTDLVARSEAMRVLP